MTKDATLTGTVIHLEEPQVFGAKSFRKALCVIEVGDKFPQKIPFEATGKKADLFTEANICEGDTVTISANFQGREYNGRYFLSLSAWKVQMESEGNGDRTAKRTEDAPAIPPEPHNAPSSDDDIPF